MSDLDETDPPRRDACAANLVDSEQVEGLISAAGLVGARDILQAFWRSTDTLLAALRIQLARGELAEAARTAHSLKGSALNVGAMQISIAARAIEAACKADDASAAAKRLPATTNHCAETARAFDALLSRRA